MTEELLFEAIKPEWLVTLSCESQGDSCNSSWNTRGGGADCYLEPKGTDPV